MRKVSAYKNTIILIKIDLLNLSINVYGLWIFCSEIIDVLSSY
jgi:hypothetical protein